MKWNETVWLSITVDVLRLRVWCIIVIHLITKTMAQNLSVWLPSRFSREMAVLSKCYWRTKCDDLSPPTATGNSLRWGWSRISTAAKNISMSSTQQMRSKDLVFSISMTLSVVDLINNCFCVAVKVRSFFFMTITFWFTFSSCCNCLLKNKLPFDISYMTCACRFLSTDSIPALLAPVMSNAWLELDDYSDKNRQTHLKNEIDGHSCFPPQNQLKSCWHLGDLSW